MATIEGKFEDGTSAVNDKLLKTQEVHLHIMSLIMIPPPSLS